MNHFINIQIRTTLKSKEAHTLTLKKHIVNDFFARLKVQNQIIQTL